MSAGLNQCYQADLINGGVGLNTKVQVECVHADTDVELQERVNKICEQFAKCGDEVVSVSYAIHSMRTFCLYAMIVYKTKTG